MSKNVPTPVAVCLGIVPAVVDSARRLPGKAVQIPVLAVSTALTALEAARREYDELAGRGERVVAKLRGQSLDGLEDWAEALVEDTPLARPYDAVEDAAEDAVAKISELLDRAAENKPARKPVPAAAPATPAAEAPKGEATPSAPTGGPVAVETAATPETVAVVELVSAALVDPAAPPSAADLPLADYEGLTLGDLRGRLRSLSVPELVQVRDYEKAHAHRLPVVTLLDNRIAKLTTEAAAPAAAAPAKKAPAKRAPAKAAATKAPAKKTGPAAETTP